MKIIKYQLATEINHGTEEEPRIELSLAAVTLGWSEANEELARREAYNGEYTVEDDGAPAPAPTTEDRLAKLDEENTLLKAQVEAQSEQADFYEDCIAEMAAIVYA